MFEANHQFVSRVYVNGTLIEQFATYSSDYRVSINFELSEIQRKYCVLVPIVKWHLDHSVNGADFVRIVDTKNACALVYKPFTHNEWIHVDSPKVIGKAHANVLSNRDHYKSYRVFEDKLQGSLGAQEIQNNELTKRTPLQLFLMTYSTWLVKFYWGLWIIVLMVIMKIIWRDMAHEPSGNNKTKGKS